MGSMRDSLLVSSHFKLWGLLSEPLHSAFASECGQCGVVLMRFLASPNCCSRKSVMLLATVVRRSFLVSPGKATAPNPKFVALWGSWVLNTNFPIPDWACRPGHSSSLGVQCYLAHHSFPLIHLRISQLPTILIAYTLPSTIWSRISLVYFNTDQATLPLAFEQRCSRGGCACLNKRLWRWCRCVHLQ